MDMAGWRSRGLGLALLVGLAMPKSVRCQSSTLPDSLARAVLTPVGPVETEMRNVEYHAGGAVLGIRYLRGALHPTARNRPPWFEDRSSFRIVIDTAAVVLTPRSLASLLNEHVFNYRGAPLSKLAVEIERGQVEQTGKLHGLPFAIKATVTATGDGRLRLHPTSVKVIGISVKGLMRLFGIELDNLIKVGAEHGVEIAANDVLLSPSGLVPAPSIVGRVVAVGIRDGAMVTTFGRSRRARLPKLQPADRAAANYLFFQGGVLRFGKLTMVDSNLQIVDVDPTDGFDFDLVHLNEQLVAGHTHNQPNFGLLTLMPDYADLLRARTRPRARRDPGSQP